MRCPRSTAAARARCRAPRRSPWPPGSSPPPARPRAGSAAPSERPGTAPPRAGPRPYSPFCPVRRPSPPHRETARPSPRELRCSQGASLSAGGPWLAAADVLAPDMRLPGLELLHGGDARGIVEQHDLDALAAQELQVAGEGAGLADNHAGDLEQQDRAGAHL